MVAEQVAPPGGAFTPASAEADGFTVRYFEAGAGEPVVRVHGAGGPLFSYALDHLAHANRVVELELPGFCDSPVNERTDGAASMANTVAAVIKALGIAPVHVWGTSMGGVVSTHLAVRHPEVVRSLILEAPGAFRRGGRNPAELSPEEAMRAFNSHPERVAWRKRTPPDPERWGLVVKIMGPDRDAGLEARLGEISVPVLVMFGVDDGIFSPGERGNLPRQRSPLRVRPRGGRGARPAGRSAGGVRQARPGVPRRRAGLHRQPSQRPHDAVTRPGVLVGRPA